MEIADAQKQLDANPAASLLAKRDLGDLAFQLRKQRPDMIPFVDRELAALERSLPGQSAARQFVQIDAVRGKLGHELLRVEQERETALTFAAQRDAEIKAMAKRLGEAQMFRNRTTGAAQGILQAASHRLLVFCATTLGHVATPADLRDALVAFEDMLDGIKGSFSAALASHIAADTPTK